MEAVMWLAVSAGLLCYIRGLLYSTIHLEGGLSSELTGAESRRIWHGLVED